MTSAHPAPSDGLPRAGRTALGSRALALREGAVLRLARRRGAVAVTLRPAGSAVRDGCDRLDLLAGLSERGLLRWVGLRTRGDEVEALYAPSGS